LQEMFRSMNAEGFAPVQDEQYQDIREIYSSQP